MAQEIYHRSEWGNPNEQWGNVYLNADLTNELYKRASEYENSWVTDQLLNGVGTKPSIILTPTAYEDGVLNSVKPSDGNADFQFSRNSSATRVNEKGLVQDVQILSGELVQNGNFEQIGSELVTNGSFDTDSDWETQTGWSISNGKANAISAPHLSRLQQVNLGQNINRPYKITFTVSNLTEGNLKVWFGAVQSDDISNDGDYVIYLTPTTTQQFFIYADGITTGSIDNVSVKEVGQNWTFGTGWSMGDGKAVKTSGTASALAQTVPTTTIGKKYKFTFDTIVTAGAANATLYGVTIPIFSTSGSQEHIIISTSTTGFIFYGTNLFEGSIDNISVVEITDDTDLPRINYTNFDYEDVLGDELASPLDFTSNWTSTGATSITENSFQTSGSGIGVYFSLEADKKYKIKVSNVSGDISIRYRTSNGGAGTVAGNFDEFIIINTVNSTTPNIYLRANSETTVTVGDVTIKELTEDVVVPYSGEGSLLLENQSTNLITYSEDFTNASWTKLNSTITSNDIISPDGNVNADKIESTGTSSSIVFVSYPTITLTNTYTAFTFIKKGDNRWIRLGHNTSAIGAAWFDLDNGVTGTVNCDSANIEELSNGWYKCSITFIASVSSGSSVFFIGLSDADNSTNVGTVGKFNYIYGTQLEQGYATSYIPTNGSTVTRLADVCNNSGSSDLINSTEGVLYAEISALADDGTVRVIIEMNDNSNNNRVSIFINSNNYLSAYVFNGTVQYNYSSNINALNFHKLAFKYKENNFSFFIDGIEVNAKNSGTTFSPNTLTELSFTDEVSSYFYGNVKCLAVFKETDIDLEKLTQV